MTKLAELDEKGNVTGLLETERALVTWDDPVPDEEAYTQRWDGTKWVKAYADHIRTKETEIAEAEAQLAEDQRLNAEAEEAAKADPLELATIRTDLETMRAELEQLKAQSDVAGT